MPFAGKYSKRVDTHTTVVFNGLKINHSSSKVVSKVSGNGSGDHLLLPSVMARVGQVLLILLPALYYQETHRQEALVQAKEKRNKQPVVLESCNQRENSQDSGISFDSSDPTVLQKPSMSLKLTKPAPEFRGQAVVNGEFKEIALSDYKGKYVVFFFYPADFTFVCPTEIIAYSDRSDEFKAINCEVIGCSTDSRFSHLAWINTPRKQGGLGNMKIPLLEDRTQEIAKAYNCLKEDEGVTFRALFIIDDKGNLRQITMNDLPVGRSVDETLRLVQAFQFTDKYGEVCPAGWKPGKATMKPDVKQSKAYFSENN